MRQLRLALPLRARGARGIRGYRARDTPLHPASRNGQCARLLQPAGSDGGQRRRAGAGVRRARVGAIHGRHAGDAPMRRHLAALAAGTVAGEQAEAPQLDPRVVGAHSTGRVCDLSRDGHHPHHCEPSRLLAGMVCAAAGGRPAVGLRASLRTVAGGTGHRPLPGRLKPTRV